MRSFFTWLRSYNQSQYILRLTSIPRIAVFLWIIWSFIPFKILEQTPASKTEYPNPILSGFVISTGHAQRQYFDNPLRNYLKLWTLSSILSSYNLYYQILTYKTWYIKILIFIRLHIIWIYVSSEVLSLNLVVFHWICFETY